MSDDAPEWVPWHKVEGTSYAEAHYDPRRDEFVRFEDVAEYCRDVGTRRGELERVQVGPPQADAAPRAEPAKEPPKGEPAREPGRAEPSTASRRCDGGRRMTTNPETCPECGLTLTSGGVCRTNGCPGPD